MRMLIYILVILVASFACFECQGGSLKGPVRNALTLDELEQTAKVIFKGTVVSSEPVEDESIEDLSGYQPYETIFNVISVFKGEIAEEKQMTFRHYSLQRNPSFSNTMPQSYNFEVGKHYFVCANAAAENQDTPRGFGRSTGTGRLQNKIKEFWRRRTTNRIAASCSARSTGTN